MAASTQSNIAAMFPAVHFSEFKTPSEKMITDGTGVAANLPYVTDELLGMVAERVGNAKDIANMRLTSKRFCNSVKLAFFKAITKNRTVYPMYENIRDLISLANVSWFMGHHMRKITVICDTLRVHEYGFQWAWEELQLDNRLPKFSRDDIAIINQVNQLHVDEIRRRHNFIVTGHYRNMLTMLFSSLPNLKVIEVRNLQKGEHLPGWSAPDLIKDLSFYREDLDTNKILYGDWKYDTRHRRITAYKNEFGEEVKESGAGPQASFHDDFNAAVSASSTSAKIRGLN